MDAPSCWNVLILSRHHPFLVGYNIGGERLLNDNSRLCIMILRTEVENGAHGFHTDVRISVIIIVVIPERNATISSNKTETCVILSLCIIYNILYLYMGIGNNVYRTFMVHGPRFCLLTLLSNICRIGIELRCTEPEFHNDTVDCRPYEASRFFYIYSTW